MAPGQRIDLKGNLISFRVKLTEEKANWIQKSEIFSVTVIKMLNITEGGAYEIF